MDFLDKDLVTYLEAHTQEESPVLKELNRETYATMVNPRMLAGHLQGQVLQMLSKMIRPSQVLEIGTFTGYSSICLCEGLKEDGMLYTIDINEELQEVIDRYILKAGVKHKVKYYIGNAVDIIPTLNKKFDIVYIDADKENYCLYYDLVFDKVINGGFIIADNVLWSGKVLEKKKEEWDNDTIAIRTYNKKIHNDIRVENVLFPIRDGLMIARKK